MGQSSSGMRQFVMKLNREATERFEVKHLFQAGRFSFPARGPVEVSDVKGETAPVDQEAEAV